MPDESKFNEVMGSVDLESKELIVGIEVGSTGLGAPAPYRKVVILGSASTSKDLAPFNDPSFEIWALAWRKDTPRADILFDLHDLTPERYSRKRVPQDYEQFLKDQKIPVFVQEPHPNIPNTVKYPIDEVIKHLGEDLDPNANGDYFSSTIAYMIALAIYQKVDEIHIYGVDLVENSEYCVDPDTQILTSDLEWLSAKQLKVGDTICGFDEERGAHNGNELEFRKWRKAVVEKTQKLVQPCYKLHLSDGSVLISSDKHRWLTHHGTWFKWVETKNLVPKYDQKQYKSGRPTRLLKACDTWQPDLSREAGYLAAAVDGEGHLTQGQTTGSTGYGLSIGFSQRENAMSKEFEKIAEKLGVTFKKHSKYSENNSDCQGYTLMGTRAQKLEFLGKIRPPRLLEKFDSAKIGQLKKHTTPTVERLEYLGEREVIGLKTSTGTFIAEGFASHNSSQAPNSCYLIGVARGKGIKVFIPEQSCLLKTLFRYGFEQKPNTSFASMELMQSELPRYKKMHEEAVHRAYTADGAIQSLEHLIKLVELQERGRSSTANKE